MDLWSGVQPFFCGSQCVLWWSHIVQNMALLATMAGVRTMSFKEMWVAQTLLTLGKCGRVEKDEKIENANEKIEACIKLSV